jgi:hypothetical protein
VSAVKWLNFVLLLSMLGACSQFAPFVDRRREAGGLSNGALYVGKSTPEKPAVCYNKLYTSYEEVKALADAECVKNETGTHAIPLYEEVFSCRLLIPNHYYFQCQK